MEARGVLFIGATDAQLIHLTAAFESHGYTHSHIRYCRIRRDELSTAIMEIKAHYEIGFHPLPCSPIAQLLVSISMSSAPSFGYLYRPTSKSLVVHPSDWSKLSYGEQMTFCANALGQKKTAVRFWCGFSDEYIATTSKDIHTAIDLLLEYRRRQEDILMSRLANRYLKGESQVQEHSLLLTSYNGPPRYAVDLVWMNGEPMVIGYVTYLYHKSQEGAELFCGYFIQRKASWSWTCTDSVRNIISGMLHDGIEHTSILRLEYTDGRLDGSLRDIRTGWFSLQHCQEAYAKMYGVHPAVLEVRKDDIAKRRVPSLFVATIYDLDRISTPDTLTTQLVTVQADDLKGALQRLSEEIYFLDIIEDISLTNFAGLHDSVERERVFYCDHC